MLFIQREEEKQWWWKLAVRPIQLCLFLLFCFFVDEVVIYLCYNKYVHLYFLLFCVLLLCLTLNQICQRHRCLKLQSLFLYKQWIKLKRKRWLIVTNPKKMTTMLLRLLFWIIILISRQLTQVSSSLGPLTTDSTTTTGTFQITDRQVGDNK